MDISLIDRDYLEIKQNLIKGKLCTLFCLLFENDRQGKNEVQKYNSYVSLIWIKKYKVSDLLADIKLIRAVSNSVMKLDIVFIVVTSLFIG